MKRKIKNKINSTKIHNFCKSLTDVEVQYLSVTLNIVSLIKDIQKKYTLNDVYMRKKLQVTKDEFALMKKGAWEFNLTTIAMLESIQYEQVSQSKEITVTLSPAKANSGFKDVHKQYKEK